MLIAFEGIDGAGTTTQVDLLGRWLEFHGHDVFITHEPSTGPIGLLIQDALRHKHVFPARSMALLFAADRIWHTVNEMQPALDQGKIVITDRYVMSSFAYQSLYLSREDISAINLDARHPDITIFLDVTAETAHERRFHRGNEGELYEADETQRRVIQAYYNEVTEAQRTNQTVLVIDGNGSTAQVYNTIVERLKPCL